MGLGDLAIESFATAAKAATIFEVRLRLLADNTPQLRGIAFEKSFRVIEELAQHLGVSEANKELLHRCRDLRNKLLHVELHTVTSHLLELDADLETGHVVMGDFETGVVRTVAGSDTKTGRIFGWLLESSKSGAFAEAEKVFGSGIALLEALRDTANG